VEKISWPLSELLLSKNIESFVNIKNPKEASK